MNRILALTLIAALAFAGDDELLSNLQKDYGQRAASIAKDDAGAHYKMALWCAENGLKVEARKHHRMVVTLSSDHRASRRALGFEKIGGRWVSGKEKMRAKGFVKHDGVWLTP